MASMTGYDPNSGGGTYSSKHSESWRLSRIEEELEKVEFSSGSNSGPVVLPGAKAGTLPRRNTQSNDNTWGDNDIHMGYNSSNGFNGQMYTGSSSTPNLDDSDDIYSKAVIKPAYSGDKILDSKEAVKFVMGKYDSLGRLKSSMSGFSSPRSLSGDLSNGSPYGSSDFPPPPPEVLGINVPSSPHHQVYQVHQAHQSQQVHHTMTESLSRSPASPHIHSASMDRMHSMPTADTGAVQYRGDRHACSYTAADSIPGNVQYGQECQIPALTEQEIMQVEMFYRSHKTEVFVCQCQVNMYFGNIRNSGSPTKSPHQNAPGHWEFYKSGIPVLVLDSGQSRRKRKLHITLAERGTGFSLWKDSMSHLTNYSSPQSTFHTMHLSNDHTKLAGFRFVDAHGAVDFYHKLFKLVSDPSDDILNLSGSKAKKSKGWGKSKEKKQKYKAPTKAAISSPCQFTHITKLDRAEGTGPSPVQAAQQQARHPPSSPARATAGSHIPPSFS